MICWCFKTDSKEKCTHYSNELLRFQFFELHCCFTCTGWAKIIKILSLRIWSRTRKETRTIHFRRFQIGAKFCSIGGNKSLQCFARRLFNMWSLIDFYTGLQLWCFRCTISWFNLKIMIRWRFQQYEPRSALLPRRAWKKGNLTVQESNHMIKMPVATCGSRKNNQCSLLFARYSSSPCTSSRAQKFYILQHSPEITKSHFHWASPQYRISSLIWGIFISWFKLEKVCSFELLDIEFLFAAI